MKKIRLDDIDKKTPFTVPEGFFSKLTSDIQVRVAEKPKRQWIPVGQLKWVLAGSFMLVISAIFIFRPTSGQLNVDDLLAQVSEQDLMDYLDLNPTSGFYSPMLTSNTLFLASFIPHELAPRLLIEFTESELLEDLSDEELDGLWSDEDALEDLDLEGEDLDELLLDYETDLDKFL